MANEPIYDVASFDSLTKLCSAQTVVENRLLPMGGVSISKVLSYSADSFLAVSEAFTGEVRVAGRVIFKVVFLDTGGEARTMETSAEFTDKVCDDAIAGGKPEILHRILDIDIISVAEGEIKLAAIVEMDLYDNVSSRIKFLQYGGEDVYVRDEKIEGLRLVSRATDTLSISDETTVRADKILLAESVVIAKNTTANLDSLTVEGEIITNLITESEGEIHNYRVATPFAHQIGASNCTAECHITSIAKLSSASYTLLHDEESGQSAANLELGLVFSALVYAPESVSPVADAFSISSELSLTTAELPLIVGRTQKTVFERVEGAVSLSGDMPIADKILAAAGSKLNVTNAYISDGRLVLEGAVTSAVMYYSSETGTKNSVDVELPFSITTIEALGGTVTAAYGEVCELSAKIRRGSEIDIKAEIAVTVSFADRVEARFVTEIGIGEEIEIPSAAISLHIARSKESLWDVAKALKTTPELILLQNPDLELPLSGGERVIVYRHIKK